MVDFLLGQSYFLRFDAKLWRAKQPFPPLGTLYAASYLRAHGFDVVHFDAMLAEGESEWEKHLDRYSPRVAVLYEDNFNYLSKMCLLRMREAAYAMIAQAKRRNIKVIVAGADATDNPLSYLQHGADFVILGEGEEPLLRLAQHITGHSAQALEDILGLAYMEDVDRQTVMRQTRRKPPISDLDALPLPAWDLIDIECYRSIWHKNHGYFALNMVTTRGCPYHCNWCAKPIWGQRYNTRSPEHVVLELKTLIDRFSPDYFCFVDDIFGLKPGWIKDFSACLKEHHVHIAFKCLSRADLLLRPGEIEALKEAGADFVWIGAESGSQKVLDAMDKGIRIEQIEAATKALQAHGIHVGFFLQFGYPGETFEDIESTFRMVRDLKPDDIGISVAYPLPGTKFFHMVKEQLGSKQNWYDSEDLAMLYQGPFSTSFYRQLHRTMHTEFRLRMALNRWTQVHQGRYQGVSLGEVIRVFLKIIYLGVRLPIYKVWLKRLAAQPHRGIHALPRNLTYEQASLPTPQED